MLSAGCCLRCGPADVASTCNVPTDRTFSNPTPESNPTIWGKINYDGYGRLSLSGNWISFCKARNGNGFFFFSFCGSGEKVEHAQHYAFTYDPIVTDDYSDDGCFFLLLSFCFFFISSSVKEANKNGNNTQTRLMMCVFVCEKSSRVAAHGAGPSRRVR